MREIKFKAWDNKNKVMYPVAIIDATGNVVGIFEGQKSLFEAGRAEIMQFTGLKDKNGKEIYEGDIINNVEATQEPWMQVVEYSKDASFVRKDISEGDDDIWEFYGWDEVGQDFEIIGNIYENPELLNDAS